MLNWIWILNNLSSKLLTIWTVKLLWISIILNCQLFQKLYSAIIRLFIYGIQLVAFSLNHSPQTHRWLFKIGVVMRGKVFIMNIKRAKKKKKEQYVKRIIIITTFGWNSMWCIKDFAPKERKKV